MQILQSGLGLVVMIGLAWLLSPHKRRFPWRVVFGGLVLQFAFAALVLKTVPGQRFFDGVRKVFVAVLDSVDAGAGFVFGEGFREHYFAFKVLSAIIFFAALMKLLYHFGIIQVVVRGVSWVMEWTLGTSGAETLSAAANIFAGHTEAPLVIRPYLKRMTTSELMSVMVGGFATVAGGVMAAYVEAGADIGHLLTASVISAPAALLIAKVMQPEVGTPETGKGGTMVLEPRETVNALDAIAAGTVEGLQLALNVGAMVIVFLAMIALVDLGLAELGKLFDQQWSLAAGLGYLFAPFAWLIGVEQKELLPVGELLGIKMATNELIAYQKLGEQTGLSEQSRIVTTYALCGFANLGSIGVQIGGLGYLVPERKADLARLGFRAMLGGTLASFMTACVASILISI